MIIAGKFRKTGAFELPSIFNDYYINSKKSNGKILVCDAKSCDDDFVKMITNHMDMDIDITKEK